MGSSVRQRCVIPMKGTFVMNLNSLTLKTVYDLTSFAEDHPGGIDVLTACAGTDATESFDFAGHTAEAIETMQRFLVGRLNDEKITHGSVEESRNSQITKEEVGKNVNSGPSQLDTHGIQKPLSSIFRVAWGLCASLVLLVLAVYGVPWRGLESDGLVDVGSLDGGISLIHSAGAALLLSSSISCAGLGFLYHQFSKTLKQERDVFSYPPVIPRLVRK